MNKIQYLIIITILTLVLAPTVSAVQISLRPATIDVPNMVQGGYFETTILLNVNTQEETRVELTMDDSPLNEWITFEPEQTEFYISEDNPQEIKIIIEPPQTVANGNYEGAIRFSVKTDAQTSGDTSVIVEPGLVAKLNISIISNRITDCRVIDAKIDSVEIFDPLNLDVEVYNNGNIDAKPEINYIITNKDEEEELSGTKDDYIIKPTQRRTVSTNIEQSLKPGQYFINVEVPNCQQFSKLLTFDILEWGAKSSEVTFTNLYPEVVWNNVGDDITIYAQAKNTGTTLIKEAQFVGKIELNGELLEVIATKSRQIKPDEEIAFEFNFKPKEAGKYFVTGTIQYDGKESFEKQTPVNVNPKEESEGNITTENILLFLAIAVVVALILITYIRKKS